MRTTEELGDLLAHKYRGDEWAYFREVPDGTGGNMTRSVDGLAMGLWPSRGLELMGFEIKKTRSDWLRELKNPAKADAICRFCDRWYIVANKNVVKLEELPTTWGLIEAWGCQLRVKVKAPKLEPVSVDRSFLAGILRRASEKPEEIRLKAYNEGHNRGYKDGKEWNEMDVTRANKDREKLEKEVSDFEEASGIRISKWTSGKELGESVKAMTRLKMNSPRVVRQIKSQLIDLTEEINKIDQYITSVGDES